MPVRSVSVTFSLSRKSRSLKGRFSSRTMGEMRGRLMMKGLSFRSSSMWRAVGKRTPTAFTFSVNLSEGGAYSSRWMTRGSTCLLDRNISILLMGGILGGVGQFSSSSPALQSGTYFNYQKPHLTSHRNPI